MHFERRGALAGERYKWLRGAIEEFFRSLVNMGALDHYDSMKDFVERVAVNTALRLNSRRVDIRFAQQLSSLQYQSPG
ncbi:hypothetical protein V8E54_000072 [Elaphomyces granulatus]